MVTYNIVYYIGIILLLLGIVGLFLGLSKVYKLRDNSNTFKELVFKNKIYYLLPLISFVIGFILLNIAYYLDTVTINYLSDNSLSVTWYHNLFIYLFGFIFALSLFALIYIIFIKLYLDFDKFKIKRKNTHIALAIIIIVAVASFYIYSEGHAPYLDYPLANSLYIGAKGIKIINVYDYGKEFSDGITIYLYAIFIIFGACLVLFVADYKLFKEYGKHDLITNTFLIGFPAGVIGARIWYVVLSVSKGETTFIGSNWVNIFNFRAGGLGIMGGAILGIIAGVSQVLIVKYAMKRENYKNFSILKAIDIIIPCILFAQAIGRMGNFFNNEVFGYLVPESAFSWLPTFVRNNMYYLHGGVVPCEDPLLTGQAALDYYKENGVIYMPLFFIEFCTNLIGYFVLEYGFRKAFKKYHSAGTLAGGYLIWYGVTRAILEPMRTTNDYFSTSVYTSYAMIGAGVLIVVFFIINNYVFKKKEMLWYSPKLAVNTNNKKVKISEKDELDKIKSSSKKEDEKGNKDD